VSAGSQDHYHFSLEEESGDEFKRYLQGILNAHDEAFPAMQAPKAKRFIVRVADENGDVVGGAIIWTYWGWLEIELLALEKQVRGRGLGRQLMKLIEDKAREEGCTRTRTEAFDYQALGFYRKLGYRVVGQLEDYPEGYTYYWMRKDLVK